MSKLKGQKYITRTDDEYGNTRWVVRLYRSGMVIFHESFNSKRYGGIRES